MEKKVSPPQRGEQKLHYGISANSEAVTVGLEFPHVQAVAICGVNRNRRIVLGAPEWLWNGLAFYIAQINVGRVDKNIGHVSPELRIQDTIIHMSSTESKVPVSSHVHGSPTGVAFFIHGK
eukprot:gb/GECG01000379.1/.p1 GENE.gb/GECG01000379.1/~~gb/GECG01000379.1/.p1  ORF type:complete len:121 (+),score=6.67 gb/GECG01000379.1/:1-363(+)